MSVIWVKTFAVQCKAHQDYFAHLTLLLLLEGMYPPYVSLLMDVLENFSLDSPNTSGGLYRLRYRLQRKERNIEFTLKTKNLY